MNLLYLLQKSDPIVRAEQVFETALGDIPPNGWEHKVVSGFHGVNLGRGWRLLIRSADHFWPEIAPSIGRFQIWSPDAVPTCLEIGWQVGSEPVTATRQFEVLERERPVELVIPPSPSLNATLTFTVPESAGGPVFISVFRPLSRTKLIAELTGDGVEIGPGANPQVLPNRSRSVRYVEAAPLEDWVSRNSASRVGIENPEVFGNYVVGLASKLPAETNSLDFIFSSHVFEHLANPLGHLKYWASLLKPRGRVVAIIPDKRSCRDFKFPLTTLSSLLDEECRGETNLSIAHYENWARHQKSKLSPEELFARQISIHAHFYTPESLTAILESTLTRVGYGHFTIECAPNHKDFHLTLEK